MRKNRLDRTDYYDVFSSPVGTLYLLFSPSSLIGISFERPSDVIPKQSGISRTAKKELSEYFTAGRTTFTVGTSFAEGTAFEKEVWAALSEVPYGETRTYKWVAEKIGKPYAFRAVGNALGKNPIPIIYPCHRIIESDGAIGGYSSGIDIKRRLLEIEYYTKPSKG